MHTAPATHAAATARRLRCASVDTQKSCSFQNHDQKLQSRWNLNLPALPSPATFPSPPIERISPAPLFRGREDQLPRPPSLPPNIHHIHNTMFRSRLLPRAGSSLRLGLRTTVNARRSLHQVPTLPHDYSQGVPNLMSPGGFAIAWSEYMSLMVEKLNALTAGMCLSLPTRLSSRRLSVPQAPS